MFELRCTVRGCQKILRQNNSGLTCPSGHHFDRAKSGYWNLLQPQDSRSLKPGDSEDAVLARHRWLERGRGSDLVHALKTWCDVFSSNNPMRVLDLGCGEGSFGKSIFCEDGFSYCGIDLSKRAMKLAARSWPYATWVLANADRVLPVADSSVGLVTSFFGRRPASEIQRVLTSGGSCIVAVPAEDDLIELREQVQETGHRRSRWENIAEEISSAGLYLVEHKTWRHEVALEKEAIIDALAMTYRAVRHSQQSRLESVGKMSVTLAADLMMFRKPD